VGSLQLLTDDVLTLLNHLNIEKTHFVGISIGGMIGQTLAIQAPDRVNSLVLANTSPFMPPPVVEMWKQRIQTAQKNGVTCLAQPSMDRWFPQEFREKSPEIIAALVADFSATTTAGYVCCCEAIMGLDTRDKLPSIVCRTSIIGGSEDPGSPMEVLQTMAQHIAGAELHVLDSAGHLSNIDGADQFTAVLKTHLNNLK
jgi:3-oxoadipate enol-lactonase